MNDGILIVVEPSESKLNIVFISSGLMSAGGGAPVSEAGLAKRLSERNSVTVLCHTGRFRTQFADQHQIRELVFTYRSRDVWKLVLGVGNLFYVMNSADVIHINGHWRWENAVFGWVAKCSGKPYFLHPRGMMAVAHRSVLKKRLFNWLLGHRLMRAAHGVIALSRFECRHFETLPINPDRVFVIPNGIDVTEDIRRRAFDEVPEYFLYFGRIEARKNLLFLVTAFSEYLHSGGIKPLVLMGPVERSYDKEIIRHAEMLGVDRLVHIVSADYGEHKLQRIHQSIAVIYPAVDEAFGRVPFEALAAGVVPIVPRDSGAAEYLSNVLPESVYETQSFQSLASLMKRHDDSPVSSEVIVRAIRWQEIELNWDRIANRVESLYNRALKTKKGGGNTEQIANTPDPLSQLRT